MLPFHLLCRKNCQKFPFSNCQNFLFQTVKISLFKLSKFSFSNCQNFSFSNCQNFPFQTVKIEFLLPKSCQVLDNYSKILLRSTLLFIHNFVLVIVTHTAHKLCKWNSKKKTKIFHQLISVVEFENFPCNNKILSLHSVLKKGNFGHKSGDLWISWQLFSIISNNSN